MVNLSPFVPFRVIPFPSPAAGGIRTEGEGEPLSMKLRVGDKG